MKAIAFAAALVFLAACSMDEPTDEVGRASGKIREFSQNPAGSFMATGPEVDEYKDRFRAGCAKPGSNEGWQMQIDPRLKPGAEAIMRWDRSDSRVGYLGLTVRNRISEIKTDQVLSQNHVLESSDESVARAGMVQTSNCYIHRHDGGSNYECEATPSLQLPERRTYCYIDMNSGAFTKRETPGTFRLVSGRVVQAVKVVTRIAGTVKCNRRENYPDEARGNGELVQVSILTNEPLGNAILSCGGATIFSHETTKLLTGELLSSYRQEYLEIPTL